MNNKKILLIEDDALNRDLLRTLLSTYGEIHEATTVDEGIDLLNTFKFDLSFVDLNLHGKMSGFKLAKLSKDKGIYTTILTGQKDQESIKKGFEYSSCDNYLFKPANLKMIKGIFGHYNDQNGNIELQRKIDESFRTNNEKLKEVIEIVKSTYNSPSPIYIFGSTGTGKQVLAELIHSLKFESLKEFYHLNCSSVTDSLLESELFGHEKGSFTGADNRKIGLFEKANGGTLFLDEIATMSPTMQNKVITAIETKKFRRVGSDKEITSYFRLIAATSSDLTQEVAKGKFRSDLFFRINGIHLTMPNLKERKEDINDLIDTIAQNHESQKALYLTKEIKATLSKYEWPGNIRELKNLIHTWLDRNITRPYLSDVPAYIINNENIFNKPQYKYISKKNIKQIKALGLREFLLEIEMEAIEIHFKENNKKIRPTARALNVHTDKVYSYINRDQGVQYDLLQ